MAFSRTSAMAALALVTAVCVLFLLTSAGVSDNNSADGDHYRVDWGGKARDIAMLNQTFIALTGDQQQIVSGIIWEASHAYTYYRVDDMIYNVSVDFRNDTVTSIEEVNDEKTLRWLKNATQSVIAMPLPLP